MAGKATDHNIGGGGNGVDRVPDILANNVVFEVMAIGVTGSRVEFVSPDDFKGEFWVVCSEGVEVAEEA